MEGFVELAPNVYRLSVPFSGCWTGVVLVRGAQNVLIDSGGCAETVDSCIVPALEAVGMGLEAIDWLAVTHIHGDHVGGCRRIRELAPGLKVAVYCESASRLRDPLRYSREIRDKFPGHSPKPPAVLDGVAPDRLLRDGELLGDLRLIHTPGHDTDSCCYLDERTGTLITGDSLQLNGTVSQGCALIMDAARYADALAKLMGLDIQNIVCGHPYLPLGGQALGRAAAREYLAACAAATARDEAFVHFMLDAGEDDPVAIAQALIRLVGGSPPEYLFLPLHTVTQYILKRRARL
jgi:hydroxyacylglutathione hydrolase